MSVPPHPSCVRPSPPFFRALILTLMAACSPGGPDPHLAENELLARSVLTAWEAGDVEELFRYFRPDALYDDFSNGMTYRGLDEIAAYKSEIHEWASDVVIDVTRVHASTTGAVAEWVLYGRQTSPIEGRVNVATGREILLNGVTILEVEGGVVTRAADYLDTLPLMLELGGRVELPGGVVLTLENGAGG